MTEAEWLACRQPPPMLDHVRRTASERKLRLFACACCRAAGSLLGEHGLAVLEQAERYADCPAGADDVPPTPRLHPALAGVVPRGTVGEAARLAAAVPFTVEVALSCAGRVTAAVYQRAMLTVSGGKWPRGPLDTDAPRTHAALLRDIFGPLPFRPVTPDAAWLAWNNGTIAAIAARIYDGRSFHDLPILADALQDAGCTNEDILNHYRQPGIHVRGCWVVDLLLGRE